MFIIIYIYEKHQYTENRYETVIAGEKQNGQSKIPYIRVSSRNQDEARQSESMKEAGINERDIYIDKQSDKDFE
jgi:hypothetical protein